MDAAVASAVDAGFAVERKDFESGIVGKDGRFDLAVLEPARRGRRLDDGVFGKAVAVFNDVFVESDVLEGLEFVMVGAKNMGEVPDFAGAPGRDNKKMFHSS